MGRKKKQVCEWDDCFTCPYEDCLQSESNISSTDDFNPLKKRGPGRPRLPDGVSHQHRLEYLRRHYQETKEEKAKYFREYYQKNKERIRKQQKEYRRKRNGK